MLNADPFALIVLFVGMSLLPFVAMVATCYLKIVVVMSLIRNALGVQSIPPNMVINALALILTFYVMAPVASQSWDISTRRTSRRARPSRSASSCGRTRPSSTTPSSCTRRRSCGRRTWLTNPARR